MEIQPGVEGDEKVDLSSFSPCKKIPHSSGSSCHEIVDDLQSQVNEEKGDEIQCEKEEDEAAISLPAETTIATGTGQANSSDSTCTFTSTGSNNNSNSSSASNGNGNGNGNNNSQTGKKESPDAEEECKMFVGQIPRDWSESQCRQLFSDFGQIKGVNVLRDKRTNLSKGKQMPIAL